MNRQYLQVCLVVVCGYLTAAVPRADQGELRLFAPASYDVETTVLLNDVTRKDKEVGYKIMATMDVVPVWSQEHTEFLLSFRLRSPKLYLRGKHINADFLPHESIWDSFTDSTFYAHLKNGLIETTYLDPKELLDIVNYKKSLAGLFQFQVLDGEYNETDVSGPCMVLYETISINVFRKIKRSCMEDEGGTVIEARRVARYTLTQRLDALEAVYADEVVTLGDPTLGIKARAWTRLTRRLDLPTTPTRAVSLSIAIESLPANLKPLPLTLAPSQLDAGDDLDDTELIRLLETIEDSDQSDAGHNEPKGAEAVLRVLPGLRLATASRLAALLEHPDADSYLSVLCRVLGLAGTRAAHTALSDFVQIGSSDPILHLAAEYLNAFALALEPDETVVLDVLKLGEEARSAVVAESALLAAAAAAARRETTTGDAALAQAVRDSLARSLARCKDDQCRKIRLQALGNLRREDTTDLLLEHALRGATGASSESALAAVDALSAVPIDALTFSRLDRLTELVLDERAPLEVRAAALDLVVQRRTLVPAPLARLIGVLYERGPHELRRILWQRVAALGSDHEEMQRLPSMLPLDLRGWDAQAHSGTSSVLVRETGWEGAGWKGVLESVQVASGGLLRRGATSLRAVDSRGGRLDALTVHVFTRGLEAFGGGEADKQAAAEGEDPPASEEAAGGLALTVGGARMRDVTLFKGQGELLGHVWAGTASSPTPVLRTLLPLVSRRIAIPLHTGVRVLTRHSAALQLALDASAHVSLWYRTARAELALKTAAATQYIAELNTAWGSVIANVTASTAPQLRIGADLDFYSTVSLCVRTRTDEHVRRRRVTLASNQGLRRHSVRRSRTEEVLASGRTLSLGRLNDDTCRTLRSGDDEDASS